jgi:hypothetical protein
MRGFAHRVSLAAPEDSAGEKRHRAWGHQKLFPATAHKLARLFYQMWTIAGLYVGPGMDYYEQKYHEQVLNNLKKNALSLCFDLVA